MDFDWPWHRVWKGYINPYRGVECPYCYDKDDRSSSGLTKEAAEYYNRWYGFKCGGHYIPHPYMSGCQYNPNEKPYSLERWEYDFILSKEGQEVLVANNLVSVRTDVKMDVDTSKIASINMPVDFNDLAENTPNYLNDFNQIWGK